MYFITAFMYLRDEFVMRIRHIMTDVMPNELQSRKA